MDIRKEKDIILFSIFFVFEEVIDGASDIGARRADHLDGVAFRKVGIFKDQNIDL